MDIRVRGEILHPATTLQTSVITTGLGIHAGYHVTNIIVAQPWVMEQMRCTRRVFIGLSPRAPLGGGESLHQRGGAARF